MLVFEEWKPYQFRKDYKNLGYSARLVEAVYKSMDKELQGMEMYPWGEPRTLLNEKVAHAFLFGKEGPEQSYFTDFIPVPLFKTGTYIWTNSPDALSSWDDLKGKRIGVVYGSAYTPEFIKFIEAHCTLEKVHAVEGGFEKLNNDEVDCVVAEWGEGQQLLSSMEMTAYPNAQCPVTQTDIFLFFSAKLESKDFVSRFTQALEAYKASPEHAELFKEYFGDAVFPTN